MLTARAVGAFLHAGVAQRQVADRIWVSDYIPDGGLTLLETGNAECRVNIDKAAQQGGHNTALGKALSWLAQRMEQGDTVIISGPYAEEIVMLHKERT